MNYTLLIILAVLITGGLLYKFVPVKTLYLIARVTPYEQTTVNAPTLLVLGDSTGYGTGATDGRFSVPGRIGSDYQVSIRNQSVNGRTIGELLEDTERFTGEYEVILLMIGANDIIQRRDLKMVEAELRTLVERLSNHTDHLLMISSGNVGGAVRYNETESDSYTELTRRFRAAYNAVGETSPLTYVDLFEEPTDDMFIKDPDRYTAIDGLHPTDHGYELWYQKLKPTLDPLLPTL
jgi:lysophospholipase L1-like esterase